MSDDTQAVLDAPVQETPPIETHEPDPPEPEEKIPIETLWNRLRGSLQGTRDQLSAATQEVEQVGHCGGTTQFSADEFYALTKFLHEHAAAAQQHLRQMTDAGRWARHAAAAKRQQAVEAALRVNMEAGLSTFA
jgi:hypothetical protein